MEIFQSLNLAFRSWTSFTADVVNTYVMFCLPPYIRINQDLVFRQSGHKLMHLRSSGQSYTREAPNTSFALIRDHCCCISIIELRVWTWALSRGDMCVASTLIGPVEGIRVELTSSNRVSPRDYRELLTIIKDGKWTKTRHIILDQPGGTGKRSGDTRTSHAKGQV